MALLSISQVQLEYSDGRNIRSCLFSLKNVDAADTVDMSPWFSVVKRAGVISSTGTHVLAATLTGTPPITITIPAGPVDDALWLLVVGVSV
jgi:hypothetical protein